VIITASTHVFSLPGARDSRAVTAPIDPRRFDFVPGDTNHPVIVGGDGCVLHTADGRRILDAAGGAIVVNIGHGRQ
jgi:adenosylmethionine-8-amino-7-oxononanoate aminotransferase